MKRASKTLWTLKQVSILTIFTSVVKRSEEIMPDRRKDSVTSGGNSKNQDGGPHEKVVNKDLNKERLGRGGRPSRNNSLNSEDRDRSTSRDNGVSPNRQNSPSTEEVWTCDKCKTEFSNRNDKLLTCEYCGCHRCVTCLDMTKAVYKAISGRLDLPWFCNDCTPKSLNVIRETKTIENRCSEFVSEFEKKTETRMANMEKDISVMKVQMGSMKLDTVKEDIVKQVTGSMKDDIVKSVKEDLEIPSLDTVREDIVRQVTESLPSASAADPDTTAATGKTLEKEKILGSLQECIERKNNVVFYNVAEGDGNLKDELRAKDIVSIKAVANEIDVVLKDEDILSIKRVGRKDLKRKVHGVETTVPRLLIVTFTETVKSMIMKNAFRLQFSKSEDIKKVGIKHDISKEERLKDAKLRRDAKKKQDESDEENFQYVVRGPTWDRKIVKIKKRAGHAGGTGLLPA